MKKIQNKFTKGFTIIELIVVIVVIGILAGIVSAAVTQYRAKGKDAAIKESITQLQMEALNFYADPAHGNYDGMFCCGTSGTCGYPCTVTDQKIIDIVNGVTAIQQSGVKTKECIFVDNGGGSYASSTCAYSISGIITTGTNKWCASVALSGANHSFCVDSSGVRKEYNSTSSSSACVSSTAPAWIAKIGTCDQTAN